jgi:hypothetical protein
MFRHPSCNSLPQRKLQAPDFLAVRVFRCPQYEVIAFTNVDETGIAPDDSRSKFDDSFQILVQRIFRSEAAAYVMKKINIDVIEECIRTLALT